MKYNVGLSHMGMKEIIVMSNAFRNRLGLEAVSDSSKSIKLIKIIELDNIIGDMFSESHLFNGCKSAKFKLIYSAMSSHQITTRREMGCVKNINNPWVKVAIEQGIEFEDQEVMAITMDNPNSDPDEMVAIFFEKVDVVILCSKEVPIRTGSTGIEDEDDEDFVLEPICSMTTLSFFEYLKKIPNIYEYANFNSPIVGDATQLGVHFLYEFACGHYDFETTK